MASVVRSSKYRHVYGTAYKRNECFENLRVALGAWDTNYVAANPKYVAVNWNAGGGGAFSVVPHHLAGKLRDEYPLFSAHAGAVLDTAFSPFDDDVIASGAEDHQAMVWRVPDDLEEREEDVTQPLVVLGGHGRKVGHVAWNPAAEGVLAASSSDYTVRLWDVQRGQERQTLRGFGDAVLSIAWSYTGSLMAATCRDKKLRIFDARAGTVVQEGASHTGVKGSRVVWLGAEPRLVTTGFSRSSCREVFLWDAGSLAAPVSKLELDTSAGTLMPFYDAGTSMLYVAGKGDGNIRYYEYADDKLYHLSDYQSPDPQCGLGVMPKRGVDVSKCEVMRFYKVASDSLVEPVSFRVPRKSETFQTDIYPPAPAGKAALSADEYFTGKNADPVLVDMATLYNKGPLVVGSDAPIASHAVPASAPVAVAAAPAVAPAAAAVAPAAAAVAPAAAAAARAPAPAPVAAPACTRPAAPSSAASETAELSQLRQEAAQLRSELEKARQSAGSAETRAKEAQLQLQQATQQAAEGEQKIRALQSQLDAVASDEQLRAVEAQLKAAELGAESLRCELEKATSQAGEYRAQLAQASARTQEHEDRTSGLQKELKAAIDAANALAAAAERAADRLQ